MHADNDVLELWNDRKRTKDCPAHLVRTAPLPIPKKMSRHPHHWRCCPPPPTVVACPKTTFSLARECSPRPSSARTIRTWGCSIRPLSTSSPRSDRVAAVWVLPRRYALPPPATMTATADDDPRREALSAPKIGDAAAASSAVSSPQSSPPVARARWSAPPPPRVFEAASSVAAAAAAGVVRTAPEIVPRGSSSDRVCRSSRRPRTMTTMMMTMRGAGDGDGAVHRRSPLSGRTRHGGTMARPCPTRRRSWHPAVVVGSCGRRRRILRSSWHPAVRKGVPGRWGHQAAMTSSLVRCRPFYGCRSSFLYTMWCVMMGAMSV